MIDIKTAFSILSLISLFSSYSIAEIKLPSFFSDNMVIQQETGANIWGTANPNQSLSITFADQKMTTQSDANGNWSVTLKDLKASSIGTTLSIKADKEEKLVNNVLVGEVWIASGQSNMEWKVQSTYSKETALTHTDDLLRVYVSNNITAQANATDLIGTWQSVKPNQTLQFTAVGYEFAAMLREHIDVPVGIIEVAWGGKPIQAFISQEAIEKLPEASKIQEQKRQAIKTYSPKTAEQEYQQALAKWSKHSKARKKRKPQKTVNPKLDPALSSTIYQGMIAPIAGYSARGAIWYQGEANAKNYTDIIYGELLECLIEDWRNRWGSNLSFYYVQLANFEANSFSGWVTVQDEMRKMLDNKNITGNIGMAVTNDIGNAKDIHPKNKKDVGQRLARWALAQDYGIKSLVKSGPLYQSNKIKDNTIEITFKYAQGLTTRDNLPLGAFEVSTEDNLWLPASATIADEKVIVSHPDITPLSKVRYAWESNPAKANLVNSANLPTSCFTTE